MNDPDYASAIAYLFVSVPDAKPHTVRMNVTVPEMTLKQIDAASKIQGMYRLMPLLKYKACPDRHSWFMRHRMLSNLASLIYLPDLFYPGLQRLFTTLKQFPRPK